ncbi:pyridoxamine 5'-phosphate oxidase [Paludibacter sp.]
MDKIFDNIHNDHSDFNNGSLSDDLSTNNPSTLFKTWYSEAIVKGCIEPNAMVLSTVDSNSAPSSRVVYLKDLSDDGFVFFTNYNSKKGKDIKYNSKVACLFFWNTLFRQVHIQGIVEKISEQQSDEYFKTRPRESQIGAWASQQSKITANRTEIEIEYATINKRYDGQEVPRPPFWGGYIIRPLYIEFWQGRENRLHDRICFIRENVLSDNWKQFRKNP